MDGPLNPQRELESLTQASGALPAEAIAAELERLLASRTFRAAQAQKKFLAYIVEQVLVGQADLLKEYVIATDALGRDVSFDPRLDPIVRTEARKLRARLAKYYEAEGANNPVRIELRKGSYVPLFSYTIAPPVVESCAAEAPSVCLPLEASAVSSATETAPVETVRFVESATGDVALPAHLVANRWFSRWRVMIASVAALLLVCVSAIFYQLSSRPFSEIIFAANEPAVAVLPLVNLRDDSDSFVSYRLTNEVIDSLKQAHGLRVVAQTSGVRPQEPTRMRLLGRNLHVTALFVGTVTKLGNRFKIAVQLNDAANGNHLWSGSYEREVSRIEALPGEIANAVSNVLVAGGAVQSVPKLVELPGSPNNQAREDYLRGLYFRNQYTVQSLDRAVDYFERAIAEDPSFAKAYAGLADCYAMARTVTATPPLQMTAKIRAAALQALRLDSSLGEPYIDLAVSAEYEFDWATAEREFKKGLELSPDNMLGHLWYAHFLMLMGRTSEVLTERRTAAQLNPVSPYAVESMGHYYSAIGRYDAALNEYRTALALEPNFGLARQNLGEMYLLKGDCGDAIQQLRLATEAMPGARRMARLGYAYGVCGRFNDARRILREFLTEPQRTTVPPFAIAEVYLGLHQNDLAFPWLEKAIDERDLGVHLKNDAHFDSIRSDPRFRSLLHRMKLG